MILLKLEDVICLGQFVSNLEVMLVIIRLKEFLELDLFNVEQHKNGTKYSGSVINRVENYRSESCFCTCGFMTGYLTLKDVWLH